MSLVATQAGAQTIRVALIGNPNTGKSTLFNGLTGGKARTGNFPGVTVEKKIGSFQHAGHTVQVIDLPGTYSLSPRSADEMVSVEVLLGRQPGVSRPDVVVCIVDASNLERNLYLFSQLRDIGLPLLLVLNMQDAAERAGIKIDVEALKSRLGVEIISTVAHQRKGLDDVRNAILSVENSPQAEPSKLFPEVFYTEMESLREWLTKKNCEAPPAYLLERMLLDVHGAAEHQSALKITGNVGEYLTEARQRLGTAGCRIPVIETKVRYDWIRRQLDGVVRKPAHGQSVTTSDRIDKYLTHPVTGMLFFVALMFVIFQTIFTWAIPFMDLVEMGQGAISDLASQLIPPGTFRSLVVDGIIAGVGSVVIFLPQILLLFFFISILEDCGYMARAAYLMDKLMTKVGLSGKSFLPLMSSYACAIPGVMATRTIENRRDRMVTMLIAPLMSCSARLPVYVLMVAAFVPAMSWMGGILSLKGLVLFIMYSLGAIVAIPVAWLLKKTFFKGETPPFVMELPEYKWPLVWVVLDRVKDRGKAFLVEAGTLIFCVTVVIWAAGYFPGDHTEQHQLEAQIEAIDEKIAGVQAEQEKLGEADSEQLSQLQLQIDEFAEQKTELKEKAKVQSAQLIQGSFLGQAGKWIEPAVKPLGWDWRIGIGAIASFPAREVIIATMGTIFSLGGDVDENDSGLVATLQNATWPDGAPLFTIPVALSVMVFFALCAQCGATLMVIRRESNSWRWPVFTFVYMTALAYVGAFVVYQVGTLIANAV